ncbi:HlyD family secretion protein [Janthinobacterium sp. PAMC25594]|uniref:HlyD family secretion protein n=1 Tax=Janthinobacterium sp. PAMC25594 TaxID=2861284 RepID=UPI001C632072|nr:HlyD family efflux transporter periplasmic adaptor subunit [Janthinobacterium sp. PAMC25594]QYG06804.1 HlyD family efflux transporter periplasmic adaptor subunit [Janthinobacterium sp. PAMC25594]
MNELFRKEAVEARKPKWLGEIIVIQPPSSRIVSILTLIILTALFFLLFFGTYTRRTTVPGKLMPVEGLVQIFAIQSGIVAEKRFKEGELLEKGQPMYLISGERRNEAQVESQMAISHELMNRQKFLENEINSKSLVLRDYDRRIGRTISNIRLELQKVEEQIQVQAERIELENAALSRFRQLFETGYFSKEQWRQKQGEYLDQKNRISALERERMILLRNIEEKNDELVVAKENNIAEASVLSRQLSLNIQELGESEVRRMQIVTAPVAGIATAIIANVGQTTNGNSLMASIVPKNSKLEARLYAPSSAIGFIKSGMIVRLRYEAYPFQRFGQAIGKVISVSRAPSVTSELKEIQRENSQALISNYEIIVELEKQSILVDGHNVPLPPGMTLQADILAETRKLYQWMFVPFAELNAIRSN